MFQNNSVINIDGPVYSIVWVAYINGLCDDFKLIAQIGAKLSLDLISKSELFLVRSL